MMKRKKNFDCVEMKNVIQRRLQRRRRGMSTDEVISDVQRSIEESDSPAAAWWRKHEAKTTKAKHHLVTSR
jgi:hypothetical protein